MKNFLKALLGYVTEITVVMLAVILAYILVFTDKTMPMYAVIIDIILLVITYCFAGATDKEIREKLQRKSDNQR